MHVVAIVPCHNRRNDARRVLHDLAHAARRWSGGEISLHVLLVDNASDRPLSDLPLPAALSLQHVRSEQNTGGSGGFSLGLAHALSNDQRSPDYLWLVDSDARIAPDTLAALVAVLERHPDVVGAGAAIADPHTGQIFESGGMVNRRTGALEPCVPGAVGVRELVTCDYVASCCALVRASDARAAGPFPDRFINADDVEWFIRLAQRSRSRVVAVPWAIAWHPRFSRFPTWTRYFSARNAQAPLAALGLSTRVRFRRALTDVAKTVQQSLLARHDLAALHLAGLADAARGHISGPAPAHARTFERSQPLDTLPADLRPALAKPLPPRSRGTFLDALSVLGRITIIPRAALAATPAQARLADLFRARTQILLDDQGYVIRSPSALRDLPRAALAALRGLWLARLASTTPLPAQSPPDIASIARRVDLDALTQSLSLDIIILSYKRPEALLSTLSALTRDPLVHTSLATGACRIVVADNASEDDSLERVHAEFPGVHCLALEANLGVEGFNRAVAASRADVVLILDDDAAPAPGALTLAMNLLRLRPALSAVTLHPCHPRTGLSEWPFAGGFDSPPSSQTDHWPVMGCANLIRRSAWIDAGGYQSSFFLYRNDMDLALTLLSLSHPVHFDPALIVYHDTPAGPGSPKSLRWHQLATRNWVWMTRRHARAFSMWVGILLAWARAHAAAGLDPARHRATLQGLLEGLRTPPPSPPPAASAHLAAHAWRTYLRLRVFGR